MRRVNILPPRRPEGVRWLRSDGTPNFSDRIYRHEGEAKLFAKRPVYTTTRTETILGAVEVMARRRVRALPVVKPADDTLEGVLTVMDIVNYFGGGELYNIIVKRHKGDIYSALLKEHVSSVMNPNPIYATVYDRLDRILEIMVLKGIGVIPVVTDKGVLWGIITEHDLVMVLAEKKVGRRVEEVMSTPVIAVDTSATLKEAVETMVKYGIRRLPILENDKAWGMITAKDIVNLIGSHTVFKLVETNSVEEILSKPVTLAGTQNIVTISPEADVGDAATLMREKGVSSLLVVYNGEIKGIITERDVLYALATSARR